MGNQIYGVDTEKEVTPIMVRDAIIRCFNLAHQEVLDMMDEYSEWESEEERERFRSMELEFLIKGAFDKAGVDFDNPTKEGLNTAIDRLAEFARNFRRPDIVKRHYEEILLLIKKVK